MDVETNFWSAKPPAFTANDVRKKVGPAHLASRTVHPAATLTSIPRSWINIHGQHTIKSYWGLSNNHQCPKSIPKKKKKQEFILHPTPQPPRPGCLQRPHDLRFQALGVDVPRGRGVEDLHATVRVDVLDEPVQVEVPGRRVLRGWRLGNLHGFGCGVSILWLLLFFVISIIINILLLYIYIYNTVLHVYCYYYYCNNSYCCYCYYYFHVLVYSKFLDHDTVWYHGDARFTHVFTIG